MFSMKCWLAAAMALVAMSALAVADPPRDRDAREYVKVEIKGLLKTHIVAIGGETTGTTITADKTTWELDLDRNERWAQLAEELNGKVAIAKGYVHVVEGTEVKKRMIVQVTDLQAPKAE